MKSVLSNGGYDGAMAVWHDRFLIKRHQIAVALRVSNGGAMVAVIGLTVVAEWWLWRKKRFFFFNFSERTNWAVLGWPDPTLNPGFGILNEMSSTTHTSTTRVLSPWSCEFSHSQQRRGRQRTTTRQWRVLSSIFCFSVEPWLFLVMFFLIVQPSSTNYNDWTII